jgi:tRNA A37 threonylcarbamoyladenosine synthetase subunit TsaC/SUA5/YrdC
VDNLQYRLIRANTPGSYTFILRATRDVPRRLLTPRHTIGVRIPDHPVALALLEALGEPLLSSTLILPAHGQALNDPQDIRRRLEHQCRPRDRLRARARRGDHGGRPLGDAPRLVREGKGDIRPFGFVKEALH